MNLTFKLNYFPTISESIKINVFVLCHKIVYYILVNFNCNQLKIFKLKNVHTGFKQELYLDNSLKIC